MINLHPARFHLYGPMNISFVLPRSVWSLPFFPVLHRLSSSSPPFFPSVRVFEHEGSLKWSAGQLAMRPSNVPMILVELRDRFNFLGTGRPLPSRDPDSPQLSFGEFCSARIFPLPTICFSFTAGSVRGRFPSFQLSPR